MIEIELNNIHKNFGLKNVLNGIDFAVKTEERIALIGEIESGKSTILKIINGTEKQDLGNLNIRKGANIGLLNQLYDKEKENITVESYLKESFKEYILIEKKLRGLEALMCDSSQNLDLLLQKYVKLQEKYTNLGGYELEERLKKICSGFKFNNEILERNYNCLSGGERTIVNLATILLKNPSILLLDEPTNHLDIDTLEWLEDFLIAYKGTILFVSHDRYFANKMKGRRVEI